MKISEVPNEAFTAQPTPIPTKMVPDWDAMHQTLLAQGFVVIESAAIRTHKTGGEECVLVKSFNNHLRLTKNVRLQTKRIGMNRWYCTL